MTTYLLPLILIGGLTSSGVYLLLERSLTRMLLGLLLIGNAVNLLILVIGGGAGNPPVRGSTSGSHTATADPLAQGMVLTAIVIAMGMTAFVLALAYRSYQLTTAEEVPDDPEDTRLSQLSAASTPAIDEDRPAPDQPDPDPDARSHQDALPGDSPEPT